MKQNLPLNKPTSYAWLVFFLSASFLFYKYILQVSPAVMTADLMRTFSLSATALGFLVGFYFYTYLIMQIPSGILLDRYSPGKLTSLAILLCGCGALIFSQTHSFFIASIGRLLIGFGAAFATTSYMKLSSIWFPPRYFAFFAGFFGTACMAGAGTAGVPLAWLVEHVGWQHTLLFCALIGFILFISFFLLVKDKNKYPDNINKPAETIPFNFKDFTKLFRNKSNWPLILYGGFAFTPVSVFGGLWGVPFIMAAYHLPKTVAASSISLGFWGFAVGGLMIGWISNQVKQQLTVMAIGTSAALLFLSIVLYVPNLPWWLLNTCIFLFGAGASSFLLSYVIAKEINPAFLVGTVIGIINMGDPLCGAIAEPLIGKILDLNWQGHIVNNTRVFSVHAYQLGLSVLTVYFLLAIICCYFIKEKK